MYKNIFTFFQQQITLGGFSVKNKQKIFFLFMSKGSCGDVRTTARQNGDSICYKSREM